MPPELEAQVLSRLPDERVAVVRAFRARFVTAP